MGMNEFERFHLNDLVFTTNILGYFHLTHHNFKKTLINEL